MNYLVLNQQLNEMERTIKSDLSKMVGKTIRHNNGKEYDIKSVADNYIETTNGSTFMMDSLVNFKINDEFNELLNKYVNIKENSDEAIKHLKYPRGSRCWGNENRSLFWDKVIEKLPYSSVTGANKRESDPHYLHLNLSDEFYNSTGYNKSNLQIGFNIGYLELAVYVIVKGDDARKKFISGVRKAFKVNGKQIHKVKEGSQSEDGIECGIRITDGYSLYTDEFDSSAEYLLELLNDTLYAIEKVGYIY